ncbi:MAG: hypothetical protein JSR46_07420 [Verrucomicrobia bacterium]|nr:hypothetical protein [Verrucomicrobiota bacterium]
MLPAVVGCFQQRLEEACSNSILGARSSLPKDLKPSYVQKEAEQCTTQVIESTTLEKSKKADLLKNLVKGLQAYTGWMKKNKAVLEEKVVSYDAIEQEIDTASKKIQQQVKKLLEVQTKPPQTSAPDQFKKIYNPKRLEFGPAIDLSFQTCFPCFGSNSPLDQMLSSCLSSSGFTNTSDATAILKQVVEELKQDDIIAFVLDSWHKTKGGSKELIPYLKKELDRGTCFGQVMAFITQIKIQTRQESVQAIYGRVTIKDIMRYHILHHLSVFTNNQESTNCKNLLALHTSKIKALFPIDLDQSPISLGSQDKKRLEQELDALLPKNADKRIALYCRFSADLSQPGHGTLVYFNQKNNTYFYYDSYSNISGGLFTANSKSALINGAVNKLMETAKDAKFTTITLQKNEL